MALDLKKALDLRKDLILDLKKEKGLNGQKAQVYLALDFSGSMKTLYLNGTMQRLLERILPVAMGFDDDGEVDFYLFDTDVKKLPNNITLNNVENYINKYVINKYTMGGTNYGPVIEAITQSVSKEVKSGGFFGFGGNTTYHPQRLDAPVYVLFITDGDNSDHYESEILIREASKHGVFFQFIGIGKAGFKFLKKLDDLSGRLIDNANFFEVNDLNDISDEQLYSRMMNEFPSWLDLARQKNLIT